MDKKIDLLEFIPKQTSLGYKIFYELFERDNEQRIKVWYDQKKAKYRPVEIKRFVDQKNLGSLLGQYQAEGAKSFRNNRRMKIVFSNKIIEEHVDFVSSLEEIGISKNAMRFQLKDTSNTDIETLKKLASDFASKIGSDPKIYSNYCKRGGYGFDTIIRSTILTEIILNLLHNLRKQIVSSISNFGYFSNAFFAKLLTGDGSISINTKKVLGNVRIRIYDENKEYLEDYKVIMKNLEFKYIRDDIKHDAVEANCTLDNLLYLYKIKAFKNTNNWNKLLVIIGMYLSGNRVKVKLRLFDWSNITFTHTDITKKYFLHPNDRKWFNNVIKKGYFVKINSECPYKYKLSNKAENFIATINNWRNELSVLKNSKSTEDLQQLWMSIKRK